ncbi:methyltransferase domain-containing protein [Ferrovibrio sp.]|uniref:methyltransferase domain-containing protein n=1 Tax=Ferrovibrio sp. TaxID=1917215 RepID=UPI0025BBB2BE|nr:methyltransferase domain-containing protein [Ferrovibrio sp.]MBX3455637.1 methyltransferase domain-containing protein [Ferrovibrio sp.]
MTSLEALFRRAWEAQTSGQHAQAAAIYRDILQQGQNPQARPQAWLGLGQCELESGNKAEALKCFREAYALLPQSGAIKHMVDMLADGDVPDRAPDDYLLWVFDGHAESFDSHLEALGYRGPEMIALLADAAWEAKPTRAILDIGCGTGRNAPLFRRYASRLDGMDLAPNMLRLSARRGYDHLYKAEVHPFLAKPPCAYDVLLSTDVFIYIGRLEGIFANCARTMTPRHELLFTIELGDDDKPVRLMPTGRFRQSDAYIRGLAETHGYDIAATHDEPLRVERGVIEPGRAYRLIKR